jgi:peptide/nickel transport system substrate-binding protein
MGESTRLQSLLGQEPTRRQVLRGAVVGTGSVLLGSTLTGLLEACGQAGGAPQGGGGKAGGTLVFGLSSYPPTLHPFQNTGTAAATVRLAAYRGLIGYDAKGNLAPEIAESWQADGDRAYVFKLRKNAKFQNGDPVTAEDVRYTFQFARDPKSTAYVSPQLQSVADVSATEDKTVRISLNTPFAAFLPLLATPYLPIISKRAHQANPNDFVGAGPFTIKSQEQGTKIEVVKFPDYYKAGLPKLDGIRFVAYADDNLRVTALRAGDVQLIEYVPWQDMVSISKNKKLALQTTDGPFMYLIFNVTSGPFSKPQVRQAIGYAIKREDILAAAFFNQGSTLKGVPVPQSSPYYSQKAASFWTYDLDKAKKLLSDGGFPNGFSASLLSTAQYGMHKDTSVVVQESLAKVGIKVDLKLPDWPTRVSQGNKGQYDFAVMGSAGDYNDPDFLTSFLSGPASYVRSFGFSDDSINRLLEQGRSTVDQSKRKQIYDQLQDLVLTQSPLVGLTWRSQGYAMARTVNGFHNLPGFLSFYSGYSFDEVTVQ